MPAHSAFMWPALCASFTPSNRLSKPFSVQMTFQVLSRLPSSTSAILLSGEINPFSTMSSVSARSRSAVMGSASSSLKQGTTM